MSGIDVVTRGAGLLTEACGFVLFCVALYGGLVRSPDLITPVAWRSEHLQARPRDANRIVSDIAWPVYPYRQARADVARVRDLLHRRYTRLAEWPLDAFFHGLHGSPYLWWLPLLPFTAAALLWLTGTVVSALFCFAVYAAVTGVVIAAGVSVHAGLAMTARLAGWLRRGLWQADVSCPVCFRVAPHPEYRCPCGGAHRDLRPGPLGLVFRRCRCGVRLPATAGRAAWRMPALCPHPGCGERLLPGAGALTDIRIVVFGAPSAGKTRFLYAGLAALDRTGSPPVAFLDRRSRDRADRGLAEIGSGRDTEPTRTDERPVALTARVGRGRGILAAHVHLFDAAGDRYLDPDGYDDLGFLPTAQGFAYVIDPLAIPRGPAAAGDGAAPDRTAADDPEALYRQTVMRMRDDGARSADQVLAVIVAKADLLRATGADIPGGSDAIAAWLSEAGLHNLVLATGRDFAEVRYFTVASAPPHGAGDGATGDDPGDGTADDPGAPLRWLLRRTGGPAPAEATAVPAETTSGPPESTEVRR